MCVASETPTRHATRLPARGVLQREEAESHATSREETARDCGEVQEADRGGGAAVARHGDARGGCGARVLVEEETRRRASDLPRIVLLLDRRE